MPNDNTRPFQKTSISEGQPPPPSPEQLEAMGRLMSLLKGMKPEYVPITKQLESIGIDPLVETIALHDGPTECLVIPVQELMKKEWLRMSGHPLGQPVGEEQVNDQ
jgi:hypothetical protein